MYPRIIPHQSCKSSTDSEHCSYHIACNVFTYLRQILLPVAFGICKNFQKKVLIFRKRVMNMFPVKRLTDVSDWHLLCRTRGIVDTESSTQRRWWWEGTSVLREIVGARARERANESVREKVADSLWYACVFCLSFSPLPLLSYPGLHNIFLVWYPSNMRYEWILKHRNLFYPHTQNTQNHTHMQHRLFIRTWASMPRRLGNLIFIKCEHLEHCNRQMLKKDQL